MKNLKESLARLAEAAASQSPKIEVVDQEAREIAMSIFSLFASQDVLKVLFWHNNTLGANHIKIELACGVRDDFPAMTGGEIVILNIWRGDKGLEYSVEGEISLNDESFYAEAPDFKTEGSLTVWLSRYFSGAYSTSREVDSFVPLGSWRARVGRRLNPEILALSHGSRLENIYEELASMISPRGKG